MFIPNNPKTVQALIDYKTGQYYALTKRKRAAEQKRAEAHEQYLDLCFSSYQSACIAAKKREIQFTKLVDKMRDVLYLLNQNIAQLEHGKKPGLYGNYFIDKGGNMYTPQNL